MIAGAGAATPIPTVAVLREDFLGAAGGGEERDSSPNRIPGHAATPARAIAASTNGRSRRTACSPC